MKKISVIIPVYNTKEYLEQCLLSIMNQTYSELEIICVDDGSTDGSDIILDSLKNKDQRLLVVHQKNGGESNARNVGLELSTGEYVAFVDCDDWIEPDMYEGLMAAMEALNVDLAASSWFMEKDNESLEIKNHLPVETGIFGHEQLLKYIYARDSYQGFAYIWNKLYKKKLFQNVQGKALKFDESLKLGGDAWFLAQAVLNVETAAYINRAFYHYRQRTDSGSHMVDLQRKMDLLETYRKLIGLFSERQIDKSTMLLVKRFLAYHSSNTAIIAYEMNHGQKLLECQNIMKQYQDEYEMTNQEHPDRIQRFHAILRYTI